MKMLLKNLIRLVLSTRYITLAILLVSLISLIEFSVINVASVAVIISSITFLIISKYLPFRGFENFTRISKAKFFVTDHDGIQVENVEEFFKADKEMDTYFLYLNDIIPALQVLDIGKNIYIRENEVGKRPCGKWIMLSKLQTHFFKLRYLLK
jgi:hypothetical protein